MSLMIPDIVKWPISELTRFTFAEVCILQPLSHWAARSYQHAPVAVAWACFEPVHLLVCRLYGESSGDRGTQSSSCVCVSVHIFLCFFSLNDIQASQDGWNGVTARFSHIIFSFCPCLHSSNPTGVVYGSVWQEKKQFSRGKERDYLHFTFSSSCDDNWTHPKWFLYAHRGLWIFSESGHMNSGIILGCNWQ